MPSFDPMFTICSQEPSCPTSCLRPPQARNSAFPTGLLNGLIHCLHRRVKTGFRFASLLAASGLFGSNLDTPRHLVREGRLFNVVLPCVSFKTGVLRSGFGRDDWVQPGGPALTEGR